MAGKYYYWVCGFLGGVYMGLIIGQVDEYSG
jgi:hypothetical protein